MSNGSGVVRGAAVGSNSVNAPAEHDLEITSNAVVFLASSFRGFDEETAEIVSDAELFDTIQRRRDAGLDGAVDADEFLASLEA